MPIVKDMTNSQHNAKETKMNATSTDNADQVAFDADTVYDGYTVKDLRAMVDMMTAGDNWKGPINGYVSAELADMARAAVDFFAGGGVVLTPGECPEPVGSNPASMVHLQAPGYYQMIGA